MSRSALVFATLLTALLLSSTLWAPGAGPGTQDTDVREGPATNEAAGTGPTTGLTTGSTRASGEWSRFGGDEMNVGFTEAAAPRSKELLWEFDTGREVYGSPAVNNGKVYFASWDEFLHCLDLGTGTELWKYPLGEKTYCTPSVHEGIVYVGTGTEVNHVVTHAVALDAATGKEVWAYDTPGSVFAAPVVRDGVAYFGDEKGNFYAVDAEGNGDGTTELKWKVPTGEDIWATPAFKGKDIWLTGGVCRIYRIDAPTGNIELNLSTPYSVEGILGSVAISGNRVFVGSSAQPKGYFYCLDYDSGDEVWNISTGASHYGVSSTPLVHDGVVYVGSNNGIMYALDAKDGNQRWTFSTPDTYEGIYSTPAMAEDVLFFGASDSKFYCLNATDGTLLWTHQAGPHTYGICSSPAVVDHKVLVGTPDGKLLCFGEVVLPSMDLSAEVMVLESFPEQYAIMVTAKDLDGALLSGVTLDIQATGLTFDSPSGSTGAEGTYTTGFTASDSVAGTTVRIQVHGERDGFTPRDVYVDHAVPALPPKPMNITGSADPAAVAPGGTSNLTMSAVSDGGPVAGARIHFTVVDDGGGTVTLSAPNGITNGMGNVSVTLSAAADHPGGTVVINLTGTADGYLNGTGSMTVSVGEGSGDGGDGGTDGTDGTDGGDGEDGDDGGDGGGGGGGGSGDDDDDGETVDVGGSEVALSTLIGVVVAVVIAVVIILMMLISRKKGGEGPGEGSRDRD